jgi:hypothetical protein
VGAEQDLALQPPLEAGEELGEETDDWFALTCSR